MKVACLWFDKSAPTQQVAELCLRFSPQICVRANEAVFIEIGKCKNLYSEAGFYARVQVILRRLNLEATATVAFGRDITEALVRAKFKIQDIEHLPLAALFDFADPFAKDQVVRKNIAKMISGFSELGIVNIAGFRKIPAADLISRFGAIGVLCTQRISFEVPITWTYWKPNEVVSEKTEFPYFEFYGELEPLLFELKKQLDGIFQRLWARSLKAQTLHVKIYCETNSRNPKPLRQFNFDFLFPQSSTKGTLKIIKERLTRDFEKKGFTSPIEALETLVVSTVPGTVGQRNLLHRHEEINEQQQALLGQLTEIHGKENIFHAELTQDRRPEKSWKKSEKITEHKAGLTEHIPLRPTHLLRPEQIEVTTGFVHIRRKAYPILNWSQNVERITGGWQEQTTSLHNSFDRNYYVLDLENGSSISVFQTPDHKFYLHGYFG